MTELLRDTAFGHLLRFVTKGRVLKHLEDTDPSIVKKYVHKEKSGRMAHHGHTGEYDEDKERQDNEESPTESPNTSDTRIASSQHSTAVHNNASGVKVDPEKGRNVDIVDWAGPDDPENPLNWSSGKKYFVTFEICLLTFSVYIGSAIYSAGIMGVEQRFGVSQVAATAGLTVFVGGYGLGPMIWAPLSEIPQIGRNPIYIGNTSLLLSPSSHDFILGLREYDFCTPDPSHQAISIY